MQIYIYLARAMFALISFGLAVLAGGLVVYAGIELVNAFEAPESDVGRTLLDSVGYMVIAVAVFGVAKYILEEEVIDPAEMRHTGEARRSITKFISTISIAIFLEALVGIAQTSKREDLSMMVFPTLLLFAAVTLLVALGAYQRLSASAERDVRSSPEAAAEERAELHKYDSPET